MPLTTGARLGPYEVVALLGRGGMGEVYRARDTKLHRDVALKILPQSFAHDPERLARFEREAQVLASLNHPHIGAIYGLEESDGVPALVLELVEGPTLAERISDVGRALSAPAPLSAPDPKGPGLPLDETLLIARQIVDAVEAAHEHGVIHRDLKPSNIKLKGAWGPTPTRGKPSALLAATPPPRGPQALTSSVDSPPRVSDELIVKVLDFGLAKALDPSPADSALSQSPTLTTPAATGMGVILGTAAYMSPEQAKGKVVDKRADIWAFGCVLYEMLTGQPTFGGETVSETLAEVMKSEPRWDALPPATPATVQTVIRRCLEKDPRRRLRDIGDVRLALEGAFETAAAAEPTAPAVARLHVWQRPAAAAIIAVSLIVIAGFAGWALTRPAPTPVVRLMIAPPAGETVGTTNSDPDLAISPDGSRIVFVAGGNLPQIYVRGLDQIEPQPLQGLGAPRAPFLSPDGNWVGFFDGPFLKKVTVNGGPTVTICSAGSTNPRGASWSPDNTIIFATLSRGLFRVSAGGGEPEVLTRPDPKKGETDHLWPEVLPGGKAVLFTITTVTGGIANAQVAVLDLQTKEQKVLVPGGSFPRYVPTGHIVYGVTGTLRAVAFDLGKLEVRSDPVPVLQRVVTKSSGATSFGVAQNGSLVYLAGDVQGGGGRTLAWVDRRGREQAIKTPPREYEYPRISPDRTKVALDVRDQENDIWTWDFARETLTRLTFDPGLDRLPVWTPDGRRIAFSSQRGGAPGNVFWQAADGTGAVERLTENPNLQLPTSFSPDGTRLLFYEINPKTGNDIEVVSLEKERRVTPLMQTTFTERNAEVSPDGRWLAYESDESGRLEVYVRPFPEIDKGRWQVSTGGGTRPRWARSGRELFYFIAPGRMMAVPLQPGPTFAAGNPQLVFEGRYVAAQTGRTYDVSADGQRFLMIKEREAEGQASAAREIVVVQNWFEELKRLVPSR